MVPAVKGRMTFAMPDKQDKRQPPAIRPYFLDKQTEKYAIFFSDGIARNAHKPTYQPHRRSRRAPKHRRAEANGPQTRPAETSLRSARLLDFLFDQLEEVVLVFLLGPGFGSRLEVVGDRVVELGLLSRQPLDQGGRRLGPGSPLGLVVIGIETRKFQQRVPLPLFLNLIIKHLVGGDERLGTAWHVINGEQMIGDSHFILGHDGVLAAQPRAVDRGAVGRSQVAHVPDPVDQPERAVLPRNVLEIKPDVATTPPARRDLGFHERDRVAAANRYQRAQDLLLRRHNSLLYHSLSFDAMPARFSQFESHHYPTRCRPGGSRTEMGPPADRSRPLSTGRPSAPGLASRQC